MKKYRILKTETTNGKGETTSTYVIQQKFIFWWIDTPIRTMYYVHVDYNKRPADAGELIYRTIVFKELSRAEMVLSKLKNPFKETYCGNEIEHVFHDDFLTDVYVNRSYYRKGVGGIGYEYAYELERLREKISQRIIIKTQKVIPGND